MGKARSALALSALLAASLLAGCSTIRDTMEGERVDYKTSGTKGPSLDVPPDLTQLSRDTRYVVPGTAVSASRPATSPIPKVAPCPSRQKVTTGQCHRYSE